ncbi:MAG TPA: DNA polymerase IV, partial [Candidatus Paceibacterota bacterium]|nr:DNA polymerase IV [Candidatus Paceibacterota bacterium]
MKKERTFLHVDGDAFFAACTIALRPDLEGKPVVTGLERGIVTAASYEAKQLGMTRAMPLHQIRKQFPQVAI